MARSESAGSTGAGNLLQTVVRRFRRAWGEVVFDFDDDDVTAELAAGLVRSRFGENLLRQLRGYVERHGRPVTVSTEASLFEVTPPAMALPLHSQSLGS